jgi:hypothetical protein
MVLWPRHGMVWHGATMPAMATLYARRWFASHPVRHGLCRGLRHCLLVFGGVIHELVAASGSLIAPWTWGVEGHDPDHWGHGSRQSRWPLSQDPRCGSHPAMGIIAQPSCWAISGQRAPYRPSLHWAVLSCPCCVVQGDVWPDWGDHCPLGPFGVSVACLLLSERAGLAGCDLSPFLSGVGMAERSWVSCALCA